MSHLAEQIYQQLCICVETDQIKLPTLPEVALKIRTAVEKETHSAEDIARLLAQDPALSARLLQLANSPLYRARTEIDNLQMAITRLGIRIVKDLVVMLAIKQAFKTSNKALDEEFRKVWLTSIDVAAVCRVLAQTQQNIDNEQAVLAGLIHNIGILPVIELANKQPELFMGAPSIPAIASEIQARLGDKILRFWNFPQSLIDVAGQWNQFSREHTGKADYLDIVQTAILHTPHAPDETPADWQQIPAIHKLGLDPAMHRLSEDMQCKLDETRSSLLQL